MKSTVRLDLPSTWPKYKTGMCDGCWSGCCTLPLEVSSADLLRLELATVDELSGSLKKLARRLKSDGIIQRFTPRTGIFVIEQRAGRDCIFLDNKSRLCTVYEKRPEVCRKFPKIGPKPGFCPSFKK